MAEEVLDLSTIVERRTIRIRSRQHPDGKQYELRDAVDLSVWEAAFLETKMEVLAELDGDKKPSDAKQREIRKALRDVVSVLVPSVEPKVKSELKDMQLLAIFGAFRGGEEAAALGNAMSAPTSGA